MAEEGTTGDPMPPFDESFILGGPHEPSHRERLIEAERRAASERVARLRDEKDRGRKRSRRRPGIRPVGKPGKGGPRWWTRLRGGFGPGRDREGSRAVAMVLIAVAVAGIALSGVHFSSGHPKQTPVTPPVSVTTLPATSSTSTHP